MKWTQIFTVLAAVWLTDGKLTTTVTRNGTYTLQINDKTWLSSSETMLHTNGHNYSTADNTLKLVSSSGAITGVDASGVWTKWNFMFSASSLIFNASVQLYKDKNFMVFSQHFPDGMVNCSMGSFNNIMSQFPSFSISSDVEMGVLAFGDLMSGWVQLKIQRWKAGMQKLPDGMLSGPLVLFDTNNNVLIISAMNRFTVNSYVHDTGKNSIGWGIMGSVESVPKGYELQTMVYYSDKGINTAMMLWGDHLRRLYHRSSYARDTDVTVNYIGYYTDNGAFYYHHTEPNKNYEDTFKDVINYYRNLSIPYRYLQYDDYWYYIEKTKTGYGATTVWEPLPDVFPHGLQYLYEMSDLPVIAHNRYWSYQTPYAKQNGGSFDFLIDSKSGYALPLSQDFWEYLFSKSLKWGLINYEQDWMNTQFEQIQGLQTNISLAETWLKQMGRAAEKYNLKLQYCMTLPREILQALEVPALSHARASGDYVSENQWTIGLSSLFLHAVGIAPFKDNFWTTPVQPGNPYHRTELNVQREAVIALLSTGPVGVSDAVGYTNITIIQRLIQANGLLLKPSKPATAIDAQVLQSAFGGQMGPKGHVYTTFSAVPPLAGGIIFASELEEPYAVDPVSAGFYEMYGQSELVTYQWQDTAMPSPAVKPFSQKSPLMLMGCGKAALCLHYVAQVFQLRNTRVAVLGELSKYVPISPQRIKFVSISETDLVLELSGANMEMVEMYFMVNNKMVTVKCTIGSSLTAKLSLAQGTCFS